MAADDAWQENWELAFPSEYIGACHLQGKDVTLTISRAIRPELEMVKTSASGKVKRSKEKRLVLLFSELERRPDGEPRSLLLNKTNARTIAALHGKAPKAWAGKRITLFAEEVDAWGQRKEAVRIRPRVPDAVGRGQRARSDAQPPAQPSLAGPEPMTPEEAEEIMQSERSKS